MNTLWNTTATNSMPPTLKPANKNALSPFYPPPLKPYFRKIHHTT